MIGLARHRRTHAQDGFTLTEMLVTLTLTGVIVAAGYLVLLAVISMSDQVEARSVAAEESRLVINRISSELRQAREITEGHGVFESAQSARSSFYSDLDYDDVPERVTYYVQNGSLYRTTAQATTVVPPYTFGVDSEPELVVSTLKDGWTDNLFEYYTNDNPPNEVAANRTQDISAVKVRLVNAVTFNTKTVYVDASTWVKIRSVHNSVN